MKLTLGKKLMGGFIVVLLLLGGIVALANFEISRMDNMYQQMLDHDVQEVNTIQAYKAEVIKQSNAVNAYLLAKNPSALISFSKFTKSYQDLVNAEKDPKGKALLAKMKDAQDHFFQIVTKEIDYKKQNKEDLYITLATSTAKGASDHFQAAAEDVVKYKQLKMQTDRDRIAQQMNQVRFMILIISLAALVIGIVVSIIVSYVISRPVALISNTLNQVARGNLTVPEVKVKTKDEIGVLAESTNQLIHQLKQFIGNVYDSAVQVASSSQQLLASNEQNAHAAEQIAQRVQQASLGAEKQLGFFGEVSSSTQEMAAGIQQIAESSERMLLSSDGAIQLVENGTRSVQSVVSHMNDINVSFEKALEIVTLLGQRSQEITGIAGLITEIANQTNLLALNAAIEAARAGEHGKGFAVVADEVRKLAVQSKKSANEIAGMIGLIQTEIKQAIEAVESGNHLVDQGLDSTEEANNAFTSITESIDGVSKNVQEVSSAVEQLTAQSQIIVDTIGNVQAIAEGELTSTQDSAAATEEQVATMEEVTSSAQGLTRLADEMKAFIGKFKV
jgi:methyl-accepting chemotaxis protein